MNGKIPAGLIRVIIIALGLTLCLVPEGEGIFAQDKALSDRGKAADKNKNGVIDRDEARGPLVDNFTEMDCDKSGTLDGGEIRGFFTGEECPKVGGVKPAVSEGPKAVPPLSDRGKAADKNKN